MKTISRITSIVLACNIFVSSIPRAQANPALVAPTVCATGIGCVLVGTIVVGGIVYYVWRNSKGKTYRVRKSVAPNMVRKSTLWDTKTENRHEVFTRDKVKAEELCEKMGIRNGFGKLVRLIPSKNGKSFTCIFKGKQTSFGE